MKLHGFHIAKWYNARVECYHSAAAFINRCVSRVLAIDTTVATGGDDCRSRHYWKVAATAQTTGDGPKAAIVIVDQPHRFDTITYRDAHANDLAVECIQRGMPGASAGVACTPFRGTAEVPLRDQAVIFFGFIDQDLLALDEIVILAGTNARPRHSEMCQLANRCRRGCGKDVGHLLVGAPIRAAYRVEKMQHRAICVGLRTIAKCSLHAALCSAAMAAARRYQRQDQYAEAC